MNFELNRVHTLFGGLESVDNLFHHFRYALLFMEEGGDLPDLQLSVLQVTLEDTLFRTALA